VQLFLKIPLLPAAATTSAVTTTTTNNTPTTTTMTTINNTETVAIEPAQYCGIDGTPQFWEN
jgi:hypothetical protein